METLSSHGIPVQVLVAPVIPGLNDHELPEVIRRAAKHGASDAGYIVLRLNGAVSVIFEDWIRKTFPVWQIRCCRKCATCTEVN